jgi:hypothetical protein
MGNPDVIGERMNARRPRYLVLMAGALLLATAAPSAARNEGRPAAPKVTSVAFHGTVAAPVIEIRGHGFGTPPHPNPPKPPIPPYAAHYLPGGSGCTATPAPVGLDYGTSLYITSGGPQSATSGTKLSAGRYRPNLQPVHELDCVGLVIVTYTPTRIVVRLGSDYKTHHYAISEGDRFELAVKVSRFHGVTHYH